MEQPLDLFAGVFADGAGAGVGVGGGATELGVGAGGGADGLALGAGGFEPLATQRRHSYV